MSNHSVSVSVTTARLTINVLDVNDNAPRFRPFGVSNFTEKILEGAQPGTTLLSVSAVDPDKGPNGQVIYQLLHLPRGGYVRLEDPSTGRNPDAFLRSQLLSFKAKQMTRVAFASLPRRPFFPPFQARLWPTRQWISSRSNG